MTATIAVTCGKCKKKMKAPATLAGKRIKCKGCGETAMVGKPTSAAAVQEKPKGDDEWGPTVSYGVTDTVLGVRCPFCANELQDADDVICLHCGYNLRTRSRIESRVLQPLFFSQRLIWWGPGIGFAIVALAFAAAFVSIWVDFIDYPDWLTWSRRWLWAKLYGSAMCCSISWSAGYFAVKRLILNPRPPEQEKKIEKED